MIIRTSPRTVPKEYGFQPEQTDRFHDRRVKSRGAGALCPPPWLLTGQEREQRPRKPQERVAGSFTLGGAMIGTPSLFWREEAQTPAQIYHSVQKNLQAFLRVRGLM